MHLSQAGTDLRVIQGLLCRFLPHVLPKGFMRIRHYGYLANRHRRQKLALCRGLLGESPPIDPSDAVQQSVDVQASDEPTEPVIACPICQQGILRIVYSWDRYSPAACQLPTVAAEQAPLPRKDSS